MTDEQNIVYTQGIILQARIVMEGMIAENQNRAHLNQSPAYSEKPFTDLIEKYGIHHNMLITNLVGVIGGNK